MEITMFEGMTIDRLMDFLYLCTAGFWVALIILHYKIDQTRKEVKSLKKMLEKWRYEEL